MITQVGVDDCQSVQAVVSVYRIGQGPAQGLTVIGPDGLGATVFFNKIEPSGTKARFIQWADFNLNRARQSIEELVDEFQQAVYEDTVNRSVYSHQRGTVEEDKGRLLAGIAHLQANHAEMVARNKVLRDRPDLRLCDALDREALLRKALKWQIREHKCCAAEPDTMAALNTVPPHTPTLSCGHPARCLGRVHEEDQSEEPHCLWCGDIKDMGMLVRHLSTIYGYITDGRITKPNTLPEEVERVADDLETERTEAAVKDALAEAGSDDSYANKLYEDLREIVPYTGHFEPGASITIHWKPVEGEVGGPFVDHGYVFVYPNEDADVGACVHIPHPDPRGDRDVSPEWPTVVELLSNPLIERIEFTERVTADGARATGDGASRLQFSEERYAREVAILKRLDELGVIRIQRGLLAAEIYQAEKHIAKDKAA